MADLTKTEIVETENTTSVDLNSVLPSNTSLMEEPILKDDPNRFVIFPIKVTFHFYRIAEKISSELL